MILNNGYRKIKYCVVKEIEVNENLSGSSSRSMLPLCKNSHLNFQQLLPSSNPIPVRGSIS